MNLKRMVVEGANGSDIEIQRTEEGARVTTAGDHLLCDLRRTDDPDTRWASALIAATSIYGTDRRGRPNATNSMIHDVLRAIEAVAGC